MRSLPFLWLAACGGVPELDAEPSAAPVMGDANGDGRVDVSDGLFVARWHLAGGPAPACPAAADFVQDGHWEVADGYAIWARLFQGATAAPVLADCDAVALSDAPPGRMAVRVEAPRKVSGDEAEATVQIVTRDLPIEAWSLPIAAEGCTIVEATTDGTAAAGDHAGGLRRTGYDLTQVVAGGAVSVVVLDHVERVELAAGKEPWAVLAVRVRGTGSGCQPCVLRVAEPIVGVDQPVEAVLTSAGRTYRPEPVEASIEICR